jgi:hypothetical protein
VSLAFDAGAYGCLLKRSAAAELPQAILRVSQSVARKARFEILGSMFRKPRTSVHPTRLAFSACLMSETSAPDTASCATRHETRCRARSG